MESLLTTTVLGALLLLSPTQARQTPSSGLNLTASDASTVYEYSINNSSSLHLKQSDTYIKPLQIERNTEKKEIVNEAEKVKIRIAAQNRPKSIQPQQPIPAPVELEALVEKYAKQYGARKDVMLIIMKCESGYNPKATNGSFGGLFQFMSSTWVSNRNAMGLDPNPSLRFNAEEAIRTAAYKMGRDGYGAWPACSSKAFSQLGI